MIPFPKCQSKALALRICLLLFLSVVASTLAADHLEIQIQLNSTFQSPARTNEYEVTATCILGTNDWYISGDFMANARIEYWLAGPNVIERHTITSSMYVQQAKDFVSEKVTGKKPPFAGISYPHKGTTFLLTNSWPKAFGYGVERSIWLAFCSGNFLRTSNRQIPLLIGPHSLSQGYSDQTVFLEEHSALSPPKTVDLFAADGSLAAHYEVISSTNILGRTLPLEFRLIEHQRNNAGPSTGLRLNLPQTTLFGKVLSIKPSAGPPVPGAKSTP